MQGKGNRRKLNGHQNFKKDKHQRHVGRMQRKSRKKHQQNRRRKGKKDQRRHGDAEEVDRIPQVEAATALPVSKCSLMAAGAVGMSVRH